VDVTSDDDDAPVPESPATATAADAPADRDASNVDPSQFPWRDLPRLRDERREGYQVVMTRSALNDMHRHGRSSPDVEVCGVIVGNVYRDERGAYLYVEASIKGDHAAGKTAQVTFTAETWTHINDELERNHAGRKILGWYHTHPGFGIFLSDMDLFIQNNFFNEPWQVAYVYDPKSGEDGVFVWRAGRATREPHLVYPDTVNTDPPKAANEPVPTTGTLAELTARVQVLEHRVRWLIGALFLVAALAVAAPLVTHMLLPAGLEPLAPASSSSTTTIDAREPNIPASLQMPASAPNGATQPATAPAATQTADSPQP
jgi:proteasome lid subunit RPN8/RPN11